MLKIFCCPLGPARYNVLSPQGWFTLVPRLTLPRTANIHIHATFTFADKPDISRCREEFAYSTPGSVTQIPK